MDLMALPKAELHVHLEGTLEPDMLLALAGKNRVRVPYANREEVLAAYRFGSLDAFLKLYYAGMAVLRTVEDFTTLTEAYFDKVAGQGVKHAELFFDPQAPGKRAGLCPDFGGNRGGMPSGQGQARHLQPADPLHPAAPGS